MYAGDPTGGVVGLQKKGKKNRATNISGRYVSMATRNVKRAAIDSPVFEYVVCYFC